MMQESANKLIANGFISATELSERRKFIISISTGSKEFDKVKITNLLILSC
jgi:hypothetical protein